MSQSCIELYQSCPGQGLPIVLITAVCMLLPEKINRKINTNMIKVPEIMPLEDYDIWDDIDSCFSLLHKDPSLIRFIKNQTYDICMQVAYSKHAFKYIKNPTVEMYYRWFSAWSNISKCGY